MGSRGGDGRSLGSFESREGVVWSVLGPRGVVSLKGIRTLMQLLVRGKDAFESLVQGTWYVCLLCGIGRAMQRECSGGDASGFEEI